MTLLYGLSALLSTYGLRSISDITSLDNITSSERKRVVSALHVEPPGTKYWNGKPSCFAKGPGDPRPRNFPNHNRKNVIRSYPFADSTSDVSRIVRRGLPIPSAPSSSSTYKVMNSYGVPPLCTLNSKTKSNVVECTFHEFKFNVRGMKSTDVKEALQYAGVIGDDVGGRVRHALRQIKEGGREYFKFEMWFDIVERVTEMDLTDKEEEREDFYHPNNGNNPLPPALPIEDSPPPPPPQDPPSKRSQVTKGGNVIPWDGKGTKREVGDRDGFVNYPNHLRESEEGDVENARGGNDNGSSGVAFYTKGGSGSSVKNAFKTQKQRWELDREFAMKKAERTRIVRESDANCNQRMVYGRAQMGGLYRGKSSKKSGNKGRSGLREAMERGRRRKEDANNGRDGEVSGVSGSSDGRSTPIRSQWVGKNHPENEGQGPVGIAERFLGGTVAREIRAADGSISTDASFRNRLNELTDPAIEGNVTGRNRDTSRSSARPPLSGWVGDYSADIMTLGRGGGKKEHVGGWSKPGKEREEMASDTSASGNSGGWDFNKIVDKTNVSSGSELLTSSEIGGVGNEKNLSKVEAMAEGSGSSVASSEIYTRDAIAAASPGTPEEGQGGGRIPSLSPESD